MKKNKESIKKLVKRKYKRARKDKPIVFTWQEQLRFHIESNRVHYAYISGVLAFILSTWLYNLRG